MSRKKQNLVSFIILLFVTMTVGLIYYEYPGLYEDTVMPASLSMKILFSNSSNPDFPLLRSGIVFIPNSHYGSFSAWWQVIVTLIAGGTFKLSFRISILVLATLCAYLVYLLILYATDNYSISILAALFINTGANLNVFSRSQFDIMFFGAIMTLIAIYQLFLASIHTGNVDYLKKKIVISSIFYGIAFYGYFSYLFIYPTLLTFILIKFPKKEKIRSIIASLSAFILGCSLYFIGYLDSMLTSILGKSYICVIILTFVFLVVIFWVCSIIYLYISEKDNKVLKGICYTIFISACILATITCVYARTFIFSKIEILLSDTHSSEKVSLLKTCVSFFIYSYRVLIGDRTVQMTQGKMVPCMGIGVILLFILLLIIFHIISRRRKEIDENENRTICLIKVLLGNIISFYIFSLPMINSMWAQHFVIVYYFIGLLIALFIFQFISYLECLNLKIVKRVAVTVLLIICLFINIYESSAFFSLILETGGVGPYSVQLDELGKSAYKKYLDGEQEIYIFGDWGFMETFCFYTRNQVLYVNYDSLYNTDKYMKYRDEGYRLIFCFWEEDKMRKFISDTHIDIECIDTPLQLNGDVAYYTVYVKKE